MKLSTHDVVVVAGENADARPRLPVPDPNGLIVGGRENPGVFVVEHRRPDVVQMAQQVEQASLLLIVPDLKGTEDILKRGKNPT